MKSSHADRESPGAESFPMKGTNPLYTALQERRLSVRPQPKNTALYEIKTSDTLTNVAARFKITPSELVNINRLSSRTLFPGQIIYVPDSSLLADLAGPSAASDGQSNTHRSPKPGHVHRVPSYEKNDAKSPSQIAEDLNKESLTKFLKINAKHITDGEGVVSGVLLVTPNHLMFDPNVSDILVIEHGIEKYGVVAPMHMVVRAALYTDIMRMHIKDVPVDSCEQKFDVYHAVSTNITKSKSQDVCHRNDRVPASSSSLPATEIKGIMGSESMDSTSDMAESEKPRISVDSSGICDLKTDFSSLSEFSHCDLSSSMEVITSDSVREAIMSNGSESEVTKVRSHSFTNLVKDLSSEDECSQVPNGEQTPTKKKSSFEKTKSKFQKGLRKLSFSDGLFPSSQQHRRFSLPTATTFPDFKLKSINLSGVRKAKMKEVKPKCESTTTYMNMVEEKPELFASVSKIIPRPAKSFDDNPLYLCLRMGRPIDEALRSRVSPVLDFGRKMKPEYWFSIPKDRVDSLYYFFLRWAPEKYGEVDEASLEDLGFLPVDEDEEDEATNPPACFPPNQRRGTWAFPWRKHKNDDLNRPNDTSPGWELVPPSTDDKEPSLTESEISLPELTCPSNILTEEHVQKLNRFLPPRAVGYPWTLIYSTARHGFSLKSLYREMSKFDTPVLLVIASTSGAVFGAMLSCPLKVSDHFYGTGESFLYTFHPEFTCFHWSGENNYFIKGNTASFAIGASDGQFGLWLDDDLFHGRTKECQTFANSCLCDNEDFVVKALEGWGFV